MIKRLLLILCCCGLIGTINAQADCSFGLVLTATDEAQVGDVIDVPVTTRNYTDLISMQYSHDWDPTQLEYLEVVYNSALPINGSNFGFDNTAQGLLNFSYIDNDLQGESYADGTLLYTIRLTIVGNLASEVRTGVEGIGVEVVDQSLNELENIYFIHAQAGVATAPPPTFNDACILAQACDDNNSGSITIDVSSNGPPPVASWSNDQGYTGNGTNITGLNPGRYDLLVWAGNSQLTGAFFLSGSGGLSLEFATDADLCGTAPDGAITTNVTGGSGAYTYQWSTGDTTPNLTNLTAGEYAVTVTDSNQGCSIVGSATIVTSSSMLGYFAFMNPDCEDTANGELTINIENGTAPYTYQWSNGAVTPTITDLLPGIYTVTVTDASDCEETFTATLQGSTFTIDAEITESTCGNNDGSIAISLGNDYTYLWSTGETTATITNLGLGQYDVTVTSLTGCTATATYTLNGEEPIVAYSVDCSDNAPAELTIAVWNNTDPPYTFTWSTGEVTTADFMSSIFVPNGVYNATVTSASGCTIEMAQMLVNCGNESQQLLLSPGTATVSNGGQICLDVTTEGFTDMLSAQFSMSWDETLLSFTSLENLNLPGLSESNFNLQLTDDGFLAVAWYDPTLVGVTLGPDDPMFSVCWEATTSSSVNTNISFGTFPTDIEWVDANDNVIVPGTGEAQLLLNGNGGNNNLIFDVEDATVTTGQQFCVPIRVSQYTAVSGQQFTLGWDPSALQYSGVQNFNTNLSTFGENSIGTIAEAQNDGKLRTLWANPLNTSNVALADDAILMEVCFTAIAESGTHAISFVEDGPLPSLVIRDDYTSYNLTTSAGLITISGAPSMAASLQITSGGVAPGEQICVPVQTVVFEELSGMQFSINWDENLLTLNEVQVNEGVLPGFNSSSYNFDATEGFFVASWVSPTLSNETLAPGTTLFDLCFTAGSNEGVAGLIFSDDPLPIEIIRDLDIIPFLPSNGVVTISSIPLVWPGDTNNDGIANHVDLLNIGLGYQLTGAARTNPSTNWLGQFADSWAEATPQSDINYRHADTNGDGIINASDTVAMQLNWGQTVEGLQPEGEDDSFLTGAPFFVEADTLPAGATARLSIILGVPEEPVQNAYGVAFSINYYSDMVVGGSLRINPDSESWLGTEGENLLIQYRDFPGQGRVDVAMVRTDGQGVDGEGSIAELVIIMEDVILRDLIDVEVPISISDVTLISPQEETLPTSPRETITLVEGVTTTESPDWAKQLVLQPNPTTGPLRLSTGNLPLERVRLLDTQGRKLWVSEGHQVNFDLTDLPDGAYLLHIQTAQGSVYEKVILNK